MSLSEDQLLSYLAFKIAAARFSRPPLDWNLSSVKP